MILLVLSVDFGREAGRSVTYVTPRCRSTCSQLNHLEIPLHYLTAALNFHPEVSEETRWSRRYRNFEKVASHMTIGCLRDGDSSDSDSLRDRPSSVAKHAKQSPGGSVATRILLT